MNDNKYVRTETISDSCFSLNAVEEINLEREVRRVQKLGNASLGISIPKEWATSKGIKAGSLLNMIFEENGNIVITPSGNDFSASPTTCILHADSCPDSEMIKRTIIGCYIAGYNTIRVESKNEISEDQAAKVMEAVERLTGVVVMEQDERKIVIGCFISPPEFPILSMIRRLFLLSSLIVERTLENVLKSSEASRSSISAMEMEIDRLYRLILRLLLLGAKDREMAKQIGIEDPRHMLGDRAIAAALESVGDISEGLSNEILSAGFPRSGKGVYDESTQRILSMFRELSANTSKCLFEHDLKAASAALDSALALEEQCVSELKTVNAKIKEQTERSKSADIIGPLIFSGMQNIIREYEFIVQIMMNRFIENPSHKFPYVEIVK